MKRDIRRSFLLACRMACIAGFASASLASATAQQANAIRAAIERLSTKSGISREVTLKELGFSVPAILSGADARREIYLPVPAGVSIADAVLDVRGHYLRTDGGRATLLLSLDGSPVWATAFTQDRGDLRFALPVDGAPRHAP